MKRYYDIGSSFPAAMVRAPAKVLPFPYLRPLDRLIADPVLPANGARPQETASERVLYRDGDSIVVEKKRFKNRWTGEVVEVDDFGERYVTFRAAGATQRAARYWASAKWTTDFEEVSP